MRFIKQQTTNRRNLAGLGLKIDMNSHAVIDTTSTMLIAKGTTAQRPSSPLNGYIRYNTTTNEFEGYQNGAWRKFRFKEPNPVGITQQNLGSGDAVETIFGPLASGDSDFPTPTAAQHVIVLVENVFQVASTNYSIVQNPGGTNTISAFDSIDGTTGHPTITTASNHGFSQFDLVAVSGVEVTSPGEGDALENMNTADDSSSPSTFRVESVPASNKLVLGVDVAGGTIAQYTANSGKIYKSGSVTGPYLPGYYIQFTSAPPLDKPVTVLHNFDK